MVTCKLFSTSNLRARCLTTLLTALLSWACCPASFSCWLGGRCGPAAHPALEVGAPLSTQGGTGGVLGTTLRLTQWQQL